MKNWFEVKTRYEGVNDNGKSVVKNETYLVEAMDFSEAEDNSVTWLSQFAKTEIKVASIKRSRISDMILGNEASNYYEVKLKTIVIDEISGKEKEAAIIVFVQATDMNNVRELIDDFTSKWLVDVKITSISESKIFDVIYQVDVKS